MRYQLLHYSTFAPVLVRIVTDHWMMKLSWVLYLFCIYIFLEQREWNGHGLKTWRNFSRLGEVLMILSSNLPHQFCLLPWALVARKETVTADIYSFFCLAFALRTTTRLQAIFAILIVVAENCRRVKVTDADSYHEAAWQRIALRAVQVFCIVTANKSLWYRLVIAACMASLKGIIYLNTEEPEVEGSLDEDHGDYVRLRTNPTKTHTL